MAPKILAFSGSSRKESLNKKLVEIAAEGARKAGAQVTVIDLSDYPMPLYNGDWEDTNGLPPAAWQLKTLFKSHDGLLLACPEYNSSITPLLKNTIDWVSRPTEDEKPLEPFTGKTAALLSASPGKLGGLRGLVHVRAILSNIGVLVLPQQLAVNNADEAFDENGKAKNAKQQANIEAIGQQLVELTAKLKP